MRRFRSCAARVAILGALSAPLEADSLTFEEHIGPLLAARCSPCHMQGKKKHGLDARQRRLLVRGGDSGPAVVPGKPAESLLLKKISAGEMPPAGREKLTPAEIDAIRRWIEEGAATRGDEPPLGDGDEAFLSEDDRRHWGFRPVERPLVPSLGGEERIATPIDAFLLARLREKGLVLAPEADRRVLIRRISFDILGLPPSPGDMDEFVSDAAADAYDRLVDRLLASPRYGERWGRHWLDAAGYADSDGSTEEDTERPFAWKYRDYVIRALNADKPFDDFLAEQLAGDELAGYPGAELSPRTVELLTATGFLRAGVDGSGQGNIDQRLARHQAIADTLNILGTGILGLTLGCAQCHDHRYDPISQRDYHRLRALLEPAFDVDAWKTPSARRISLYTEEDRRKAAEVAAAVEKKRGEYRTQEASFVAAVADKVLTTQVADADREAARAAREAKPEARTAEQKLLLEKYPSLNVSAGTLYQYDAPAAEKLKAMNAEIEKLAAQRPPEDFVSALWEEPAPRRAGRLFIRGNPDQPAEEVAPGVPAVLVPPGANFELPAKPSREGIPSSSGRRLQLARWLTSPDQPLTARVIANRLWMHHFGGGLVPSAGDFGLQGDPPTHPELLDWLAAELMRGGWRLKPIHRLILTSAAYRQSARATEKARDADPENRLLGRRSLLRIEGEVLRDAILAVSGALSLRKGGPPVPVREDADGSIVVGIDQKAESNRPGGEVPIGEEEFRRTVYVQVRRTRPLSFLGAFDTPVMETNCPRRSTSIVATQALVLLNGPFVRREAERFARRLLCEAVDDDARVDLAFRLAFGRPASPAERDEALAFLREGARLAPQVPAPQESKAESKTESKATPKPLVDFCHAIFNAGEFVFVE